MIGRTEEIKKIKRLLNSNRSEFLAVTGRRRVGKTYLVDETLRHQYCFSLTGIQNEKTAVQLVNFGVKLAEYDGTLNPEKQANWQMAFLRLKAYLQTLDKSKKQVIFLDELPWISTARSGFIQMLAHLWNDYLSKEKHFLLVICGSATSWITRKIISDPGGLHNRVTEIIHLHPFTIGETKLFLKTKGLKPTNQEIARIYMTLGGIPFYLEGLRKGESFSAAIERMCFAPNGILHLEYQNLYQALFTNAEMHQAIIEILAKNRGGQTRNQIASQLKTKKTGSFNRAIEELIMSDFVEENIPFGKKKRDSFYRVIDEFSVFYHRFIKPTRKYSPGLWQQLAVSQTYKVWAGYAFEALCHKHVSQIKNALGIAAVYTEISSLRVPAKARQAGFQIDLIIDRKDDSINLCEIKFHNGTFLINKKYHAELQEKRNRFIEFTGTKKQVFMTLITNMELVQNDYATEIVDAQVILDDLVFS